MITEVDSGGLSVHDTESQTLGPGPIRTKRLTDPVRRENKPCLKTSLVVQDKTNQTTRTPQINQCGSHSPGKWTFYSPENHHCAPNNDRCLLGHSVVLELEPQYLDTLTTGQRERPTSEEVEVLDLLHPGPRHDPRAQSQTSFALSRPTDVSDPRPVNCLEYSSWTV